METPLQQLHRAPKELLSTAQGRRALTKEHPGLFGLIYLREHLTDPNIAGGSISFSTFHLDLYNLGRQWMTPLGKAREFRDAVIAPRQSGKSTTMFLVLPMWAAAHRHTQFIAAFSDSASQAEQHLATFKQELQTNQLLRNDFPELVTPRKGTNVSRVIADNRGQYVAESGLVFQARGVTSGNLGMKVGHLRPDLIILDDVEPDGATYSEHQAKQRLDTIRDSIFYLNEFARVVLVGTTTMPGSIIHQIQAHKPNGEDEPCDIRAKGDVCWICDENIRSHYYPAIIKEDDGSERSLWPERWAMEEMNEVRHTRSFAKNMMNEPVAEGEGFWTETSIKIGSGVPTKTIVFVDPATTSHKKSDQTGISVVSIDEMESTEGGGAAGSRKVVLRESIGIRETPGGIAKRVLEYVEEYEADAVIVESNQGGNLWKDTLSECPVPVHLTHSTKKKEYRISRAFSHYEKGRVLHATHLPQLEEQQLAFPNLKNDDIVDAASTGILYILGEVGNKNKRKSRQMSYV